MDITAVAGAAMLDDQRRMENISHNIANVLTPGYKRQVAIGSSFQSQFVNGLASPPATRVPASGSTAIDPAAGPLRATGNANDVAIEGDSFFELATPSGSAFTRQGQLRVDAAGRLVGAQGFPLIGEGGPISLTNAPFSVAPSGDITQDGRTAGRIKRVRFGQAHKMAAQGAGMYLQGGATVLEPAAADRLRIGMQEASNVSSPQEMVRLTETVRHFESLQKIVQGYDESLEKAIRKLGEF